MKKVAVFLPGLIFLLFCFGFSILHHALPDKSFSEQENRELALSPALSLSSFLSGDWTREYETYLADQFPFRNTFVTVKAGTELALGKTELSGIYICKDGLLAAKFEKPDDNRVRLNTAAIAAFAEKVNVPVYFTVVPGITALWADRLPENAPNPDQLALVDQIAASAGAAIYVDTKAALLQKVNEPIYYTTDHHWTTLGAYYGYEALANAMGLEPQALPNPYKTFSHFYGTSSSSAGIAPGEGDTVTLYIPDEGMTLTVGNEEKPLYDMSFAEKKDKYSVFLGGNYPLAVLKTGQKDLPKLLLVKDSYANAEIPFLAAHFSEIHIVDPRFYRQSLSSYVEENQIEQVVVSFYLVNFVTDNNIALIK
ncbi:MAG TPA: hypothetical protein GX701_08995 [Clostridiales bacterium]|nr:hypothetical protein [Clostridiales bacterium]